jgi:alkanesulfonate monooxygenase SsuD/methylene tetrahydromethanopterin reductase-like flavin-dependent oxidoreductase (luciferase family)
VAGFGTGGTRVFAPLGITPARPYSALRECLDVVQALWRAETVTHAGQFRANAAQLTWRVKERIPLAVAGRGPRVERLGAERADWFLVAGRAVETVPALFERLRTGRHRPSIAWNPVAAWTEAMREDLRGHLAYMASDMPAADRPQVITDDVLERYAIVGTRAQVAQRLGQLRQQLSPELLVFDAGDYSVQFLEELASIALDAGTTAFHNEVSPHGLDSND